MPLFSKIIGDFELFSKSPRRDRSRSPETTGTLTPYFQSQVDFSRRLNPDISTLLRKLQEKRCNYIVTKHYSISENRSLMEKFEKLRNSK